MEILNKDLEKKHLHALSVYSLIMPESYVCLPFMYTDTPEKEHAKIHQAEVDLNTISDEILHRQSGIVKTTRGLTPWTFSHVIGAYFNARMITDKKFTVDAHKCIGCGKCQKVCPVDNIQGTPPAWLHNGRCTSCLACYHYCPEHAINYGNITRKRDQYYFNKRGDRR
jgi:ferredoxin